MPFQEGHKKSGGRQKGSVNRVNKRLREQIEALIYDNWEQVTNDITSLEPKARVEVVIKFFDFLLPRLNKVNIDQDSSIDHLLSLSEVDINNRIIELRRNIEDDQ